MKTKNQKLNTISSRLDFLVFCHLITISFLVFSFHSFVRNTGEKRDEQSWRKGDGKEAEQMYIEEYTKKTKNYFIKLSFLVFLFVHSLIFLPPPPPPRSSIYIPSISNI